MTGSSLSLECRVAVVGGGFAGSWVAYRLAQRGVRTVLISAEDQLPAVSRALSVGFVRRQVLDHVTTGGPDAFLDSSTTQDPGYREMMAGYLPREFEELTRIVSYSEFDEYLRPGDPATGVRVGLGDEVVAAVLARFEEFGGVQIQGRVTDFVVDEGICLGLRYQFDGVPGRIACNDVVLASGGFCGLFADGVGTNSGYLLGAYARHGGALANLELFARFALGDLDRKVPCYPFEFDGPPRFLRAGEPAGELAHALDDYAGDLLELDVFRHYWIPHLDMPHTAETSRGAFRMGPIKGFAMGGVAPSTAGNAPRNIHATGECAYDLAVDSISGKPFPTYLARGGMLVDELTQRSGSGSPTVDFAAGESQADADPLLRKELGHRLDSFQDTGFSVTTAERFIQWCRDERRRRRDERCHEDVDLLTLAEAYACSALARTESRGFFYRPDFPAPDPALAGRHTVARYDAATDRIVVGMHP